MKNYAKTILLHKPYRLQNSLITGQKYVQRRTFCKTLGIFWILNSQKPGISLGCIKCARRCWQITSEE